MHDFLKSEAIDTDQSVAFMVKKWLLTPIGGKYVTETSIDTDSDHVSRYGVIIVRRSLHLTAYYCYYGRAVLIRCIEYGRREENMHLTAERSWNLCLKSIV